MLANVLHAARRILTRSPSVQSLRSQEDNTTRDDQDDAMVSTRSGAVVDGTPRSETRTRSGKRALEVESTPTTTKRRRKSDQESLESPEHAEQEEVEVKDDIVTPKASSKNPKKLPVRERATRSTPRTKPSPLATSGADESGEIDEHAALSSPNQAFFTPGPQRQGSVYETPATSKPTRDGSATPKPAKTSVQVVVKSGKGAAKKSTPKATKEEQPEIPSSTFDSEEAGLSTQESALGHGLTSSATPTKSHVRFGSEEPVDPAPVIINKQGHKRFGAERPSQIDEDEQASSDSDDDAPETVTAASAISKAQAAEAGAAQALKAQQEREKQKQEKRATVIAEEKEAKRKKQEKEARRVAQREAARSQKLGLPEPALDLDTNNLPNLLPESLLEAIGDQRPPTPPPMPLGKTAEEKRREKLNRHIKFLERGEKRIKDVKKGPVNVSVLGEQNKLLPPKVNKDTKNIREKWLKGRQNEKKTQKGRKQMGFKKVERRPITSGFVRDDDW